MMKTITDHVIISRLLKYKDPFKSIGLKQDEVDLTSDLVELYLLEGQREYEGSKWIKWHSGRVLYFKEKFDCKLEVDPIIIYNDDKHGKNKSKFPSVFDGFHRLCGAILAGQKRIEAEQRHNVYAWNWLVGKTDKDPIELLNKKRKT